MSEKYLSWAELTNKKDRSSEDRVLIQSVALLSTQSDYEHMTPWDVYDMVVEQTKEVYE